MGTHAGLPIVALLSRLANAGTISSPPVLSLRVDTHDACYVRNVGANPVSVTLDLDLGVCFEVEVPGGEPRWRWARQVGRNVPAT